MKDLINKIIQDLGNDVPIKRILLKSQILASKLENKEFAEWIYNEQNGYQNSENLPEYRVLPASIKADITQPYVRTIKNYTIPSGLFKEKIINDCIFHVRIALSLSEIENLCNDKTKNSLTINLPAFAYKDVGEYINGNIDRLWQEFSAFSLENIVDTFKSKLLSFFIDLDKKIDAGVDFSQIEGQKEINKIMNNYYNINAIVANTGDGTVNSGDISNNNSTQYLSDQEIKDKIKSLLDNLSTEAQKINNSDLNEAVENVKQECKKASWCKKSLKIAFNAVLGVATGIAANQITPIVTKALALL